MSKTVKWTVAAFVGLAAAAFFVLLACLVGSSGLELSTAARILLSRVPFFSRFVSLEGVPDTYITIVFALRLPRALGGLLVGGGLAVCGGALQGMFKNPLADSGVLGISSGAGLGAGIAIVLGLQRSFGGVSGVSLFAFFGGLFCIVLVYFLSQVKGQINTVSLLLAGTALSALASATLQLLMMMNYEKLDAIFAWSMGSLASVGWRQLGYASVAILTGSALLCFQARPLNLMQLGDEEARHLGVNTQRLKLRLMVLSALVASAAVSISGIIGFVGLMVPHILRMLLGPNNKILLPLCFLWGGAYLLLVDILAKTVIAPLEMPIGVLTSVLGGPFFIYLLRRGGGLKNAGLS